MPMIGRRIYPGMKRAAWGFMQSGDFPVPVLWLKFGKNTGTEAKDSSPEGNDGTIEGASWVDGILGPGLEFDGIDNYVDCGADESLDNAYPITIIFWINTATPAQAFKRVITSGSGFTYSFSVITVDDKKLQFGYGESVADNTKKTSFMLGTSVWQQVALILQTDMTDAECYLNSVAGTITVGGGTTLDVGNVTLGRRPIGTSYLSGILDDVRIYDIALTAAQIRQIYLGYR